MYITKIKYDNFRNLKKGEFCPGREINVIYGNNAQGKTNLTESIWLFTGQKSFRGNKDKELVNKDNIQNGATLQAEFFSRGRNQTARLEIGQKKKAILNDVTLTSPQSLAENFCAIIFSPAEMQLISEGPSVRRKFIDNAISVLRPKYAKAMNLYNRAVQQRNALMKDVQYHSELDFMLDSFEEHIAKSGAYIILQRKSYIDAVMKYMPDIYGGISENKEKINIKYKTCVQDDEETAEIIEQSLRKKLYESRKDDIQTLTTSVGPHRDDIDFYINGDSVKIYGSQGQRRSVVLALKLSEAEILKKFRNEQPITILDDVMSELDRSRQDYILNHIKGSQVFITCCDPSAVEHLSQGNCVYIDSGKIIPQN